MSFAFSYVQATGHNSRFWPDLYELNTSIAWKQAESLKSSQDLIRARNVDQESFPKCFAGWTFPSVDVTVCTMHAHF